MKNITIINSIENITIIKSMLCVFLGKIVQRGCQNQLDSSQFDKCRHGKWCTLCCENNCNNEKIVESKSGRLIVNYMVFLSLFLSIIPFRLE